MNYYSPKSISKIEIDCTSYCNAYCGACDRNVEGGEIVPGLMQNHLSLDAWKNLVEDPILDQVNEIIFNGNFGDFSMHPDFIEMMEILAAKKSNIYLNLNTNGGARNLQFWKELAQVLQRFEKHDIKFGIDGLEETHNIYRRGIDWNKRIENLKSFNDAGGNSIWKCIVFDYNKNQIDDMSNLAKELGCIAFQTNRNRNNPLYMKAYKNFTEGHLTSPDQAEFKKSYMRKDIFRQQKKTPETLAEKPIGDFNCPYAQEGMIQIDAWGNVWPCCYISGRQIDKKTNFDYNKYTDNNIKYKSLTEILEFIKEDIYNVWEHKSIDICNKCAGIKIPTPSY
jgi:hypothetical protein